jgi:hypothetical protein
MRDAHQPERLDRRDNPLLRRGKLSEATCLSGISSEVSNTILRYPLAYGAADVVDNHRVVGAPPGDGRSAALDIAFSAVQPVLSLEDYPTTTDEREMSEITEIVGSLLCKIPVGLDLCLSSAGRSLVGTWGIIGIVGLVALFFLMRNPRRA